MRFPKSPEIASFPLAETAISIATSLPSPEKSGHHLIFPVVSYLNTRISSLILDIRILPASTPPLLLGEFASLSILLSQC